MTCIFCGHLYCVCGRSDPDTIQKLLDAAREYELAECRRREYQLSASDQRVMRLYASESETKLRELDIAVIRYCRFRSLP